MLGGDAAIDGRTSEIVGEPVWRENSQGKAVPAPPGSRSNALQEPWRRKHCQWRSKKGPFGGVRLGHSVLEACPRSPREGPARAAACLSMG